MFNQLCSFRASPFALISRDLVTDFGRQSYPDRVPDPGRAERSLDPLGRSSARRSASVLGLLYFVLIIRPFRNYGEVGRKARIVQRLMYVQIELVTPPEWARDRGREEVRAGARARGG